MAVTDSVNEQYHDVLPMAWTVASFTKDVNPRLAKRLLKTNGRLANRWLTSLVKEATAGVLCTMRYPSETRLKLKPCVVTYFVIVYSFWNFTQWYCRALCKLSKRLNNWDGCYEQTSFRRIAV